MLIKILLGGEDLFVKFKDSLTLRELYDEIGVLYDFKKYSIQCKGFTKQGIYSEWIDLSLDDNPKINEFQGITADICNQSYN